LILKQDKTEAIVLTNHAIKIMRRGSLNPRFL